MTVANSALKHKLFEVNNESGLVSGVAGSGGHRFMSDLLGGATAQGNH
jgi:hypothetical protein